MITLEITTGTVILGLAAVGAVAYGFYRVGKKTTDNKKDKSPKQSPLNDYIKSNPSTPLAQKAFLENVEKFMPFFNGVTSIDIDKDGLTDAIIDTGNKDLIALWKQMVNRTDLWLNQMAAWGVAPDARTGFVAMEKHNGMYITMEGHDLQIGKAYTVTSACWVKTETLPDGTVKKSVIRKGTVEEKQ